MERRQPMTDNFGSRLQFVRKKWNLTQDQLADHAAVGVATIRRMENGYFDPRLSTAQRLADALQVRVDWLLTGDADVMVWLAQMTVEEQHRQQNGPGSEGLPGYVIVGPGPWHLDDDDEWQIDRSATGPER